MKTYDWNSMIRQSVFEKKKPSEYKSYPNPVEYYWTAFTSSLYDPGEESLAASVLKTKNFFWGTVYVSSLHTLEVKSYTNLENNAPIFDLSPDWHDPVAEVLGKTVVLAYPTKTMLNELWKIDMGIQFGAQHYYGNLIIPHTITEPGQLGFPALMSAFGEVCREFAELSNDQTVINHIRTRYNWMG